MADQTRGTGTDLSIKRRTVLKAGGTTVLGLTGLSGTASASPPSEIRFCGCSQVCVQTDASYRILYATETDGGYTCSLEPSITGTEPTSSDCYTVAPGEKIIGVLDGTRTLFQNPNNCAQQAIEAIDGLNDCAGCTADDGPDGDCIRDIRTAADYAKEGPHKLDADGITIRTRRCKPPAKWKDDPNGPSASRGPPKR